MQPPEHTRHPIAPKLALQFYTTHPFSSFAIYAHPPNTPGNKLSQRVIDAQYKVYAEHIDELLSRLSGLMGMLRPRMLKDLDSWEELEGWETEMDVVLGSLKRGVKKVVEKEERRRERRRGETEGEVRPGEEVVVEYEFESPVEGD